MKQVIDKLIEIKNKHARAFFATYGDMADAFARNEVTVERHRLGSGRGLGQAEGQDDQIHDPARKAPACSWTACASRRTARIPSSPTR